MKQIWFCNLAAKYIDSYVLGQMYFCSTSRFSEQDSV